MKSIQINTKSTSPKKFQIGINEKKNINNGKERRISKETRHNALHLGLSFQLVQ